MAKADSKTRQEQEDIESIMNDFDAGFAAELKAKMGRIDKIIGEDHWLSVGSYKERLLREHLIEYLPKAFEVGTGFLLASPDGHRKLLSRQIDLLIWDSSRYAPFFRDRDFVILPPAACRAAIEVKWHIDKQQLQDGILNLLSVCRLAKHVPPLSESWYRTYLFALDSYETLSFPDDVFDTIQRALLTCPYAVTANEGGEPVTEQCDLTIEERHAAGKALPLMASLYWPGTIAILGKGIVKFSRFHRADVSGYACSYRVAKEQDLTFGHLRRELSNVLQAQSRKRAEIRGNNLGGNTDLFMPLPYSTELKSRFEASVTGLDVYEPAAPWIWTPGDAIAEHLRLLARKEEKNRKSKDDAQD